MSRLTTRSSARSPACTTLSEPPDEGHELEPPQRPVRRQGLPLRVFEQPQREAEVRGRPAVVALRGRAQLRGLRVELGRRREQEDVPLEGRQADTVGQLDERGRLVIPPGRGGEIVELFDAAAGPRAGSSAAAPRSADADDPRRGSSQRTGAATSGAAHFATPPQPAGGLGPATGAEPLLPVAPPSARGRRAAGRPALARLSRSRRRVRARRPGRRCCGPPTMAPCLSLRHTRRLLHRRGELVDRALHRLHPCAGPSRVPTPRGA